MSKQITIGRIVMVDIGDGEYRPAIVNRVHSQEDGGVINARVFDDSLDAPLRYSLKHGRGLDRWLWPDELQGHERFGVPAGRTVRPPPVG